MADDTWNKLHTIYQRQDWINKPSMFAETAISYFPDKGKLLDLGAGLGQDSLYFARQGYDVTATDLSIEKLSSNTELTQQQGKVHINQTDLRQPLPFDDKCFDIVYAHLSLHYFDAATTASIFSEIQRVLRPSGIMAFFTNSTSDPEYETGTEIEQDYFEIDGVTKRYFSVESAKHFAQEFKTLLADNEGETYKDSAKGIHGLIRYIGIK